MAARDIDARDLRRAFGRYGTTPPRSGTIFRIVDFPPPSKISKTVSCEAMVKVLGITERPPETAATRSPYMHRTKSIDYAIVLEGEIAMLPDGSEAHLDAGEILIQRSTNHAWVNRGKERCPLDRSSHNRQIGSA